MNTYDSFNGRRLFYFKRSNAHHNPESCSRSRLLSGIFTVSEFGRNEAREDDLFTITLSLIITLWIGKIVTNFPLFIKNPQAGLAYPAGKYALYAGLVMTGIYIVWHYSRKGESRPWPDVLLAGLMVIISGQFLYGFFNFVFEMEPVKISYLIFYSILLIVMIFTKGLMDRTVLAFGLLAVFAAGQVILGFFWKGYLFQFLPGPIFWFIIMLAGLYGLLYQRRLRNRGGHPV